MFRLCSGKTEIGMTKMNILGLYIELGTYSVTGRLNMEFTYLLDISLISYGLASVSVVPKDGRDMAILIIRSCIVKIIFKTTKEGKARKPLGLKFFKNVWV